MMTTQFSRTQLMTTQSISEKFDVYFIGRIIGSTGFNNGTFCRWWVISGQNWTLKNGNERGQTQADSPKDSGGPCIWSHPIDMYFESAGIQGWPKISFEVWEHDSLNRSFMGGYGFCTLPMSPGNHDITVHLWRPISTAINNMTAHFIGGSPHLRTQDLVHTHTDRFRLRSESAGTVHLNISVVLGKVNVKMTGIADVQF